MSQHRKEVHFFDQHYANGPAWYSSFFSSDIHPGSRVGETTPHYLYHPDVPRRIADLIPGCQLIAMLRDPIDRAFSQYAHNVKTKGWTHTFEEAIEREPQLLERGMYAHQLARFLQYFDRERLLICIFEEATTDPASAAVVWGQFLGVDADGFDWSTSRSNASYVPRLAKSYAAARGVGRFLRKARLDAFVEGAKKAGIPQLFGSKGGPAPMKDATRERLVDHFAEDRHELETLLRRRIAAWD